MNAEISMPDIIISALKHYRKRHERSLFMDDKLISKFHKNGELEKLAGVTEKKESRLRLISRISDEIQAWEIVRDNWKN